MKIFIQYYAQMREQRGLGQEEVETSSSTALELYEELRGVHSFTLNTDILRVAVNDAYVPWEAPLREGDKVIFIPPVAGG